RFGQSGLAAQSAFLVLSSTFFPGLFRLRFGGFDQRGRCHGTRPSLCRRRPDSVPAGGTELSSVGQADESPGRRRTRSSDWTRREYSGPPRSQRTHDSFDCRPGGGEAMAFQAVPAIRAGGRNRGPHYGKLHHLDPVETEATDGRGFTRIKHTTQSNRKKDLIRVNS